MKSKKHIRSLTAISIRLGATIFGLWFLCMSLLTLAVTQYIFNDLSAMGIDYAQYAAMTGRLNRWLSPDDGENLRSLPGAAEYAMNRAIAHAKRSVRPATLDSYPGGIEAFNVFSDQYFQCDTAIIVLDKEGNVVRSNGDFIYFDYVTEDTWTSASEDPFPDGYAWVDLGDETDSRYENLRSIYEENYGLYFVDAIRITGYWDGSRIEPVSMALLTAGAAHRALESVSPGWNETADLENGEMAVREDGKTVTVSGTASSPEPPYSMYQLDAMGALEWDVCFDHGAQADPRQELVTIYARAPEMTVYEPEGTIRYQKTERYENLLELLKTKGVYRDAGQNIFCSGASQFDLCNLIVFSSHQLYGGSKDPGVQEETYHQPEYTIVTAMHTNPVKIAVSFLGKVYWLTFAAAFMGFLLIRRSVKKHLILPLRSMNEGMAAGWKRIMPLQEKAPKWEEAYELWRHYDKTREVLNTNQNELSRLNTALEYAKTGEQRRRQMTSNIAHELKTPLAVIHSYAEGLKEHIAEEKREKYLDVILSEAERTDALVLEMLDLSRLEAGKVRLARDDFSLGELTKSIFEKLRLAAEAKNLQISFDFPEESTITADESRIAQVVENFASNGVKYTPQGGSISVGIWKRGGKTSFTIANDCKPFSQEELSKVWDTFYRRDEARSGGGTGLGLAIAKSIIELHGGSCSVHNTETGVQFMFTI